jgi:anti-anti-sigma regulatory factor
MAYLLMMLIVALKLQSLKEVFRDLQSKDKKVLLLNWRPRVRHAFVKFDGRDAEIFIPNASQPALEDEFKSRSNVY